MNEKEIIKEQIEQVSPAMKEYLASAIWEKMLDEITKENVLTPDQSAALSNEVLFVLLSMELVSDFPKNIQSVGLDAAKREVIMNKVKERIFKEVEDLLPTEAEPDEALPEIPLQNLPAVEPGQIAHQTTPEEKKFMEIKPEPQPIISPSYAKGKDPYREPIE